MKKFISICLLGLSSYTFAQNASMFDGMKMPSNNLGASSSPTANANIQNVSPVPQGLFESQSGERTMDKIFDVNKDSFDTDNGVLNWKGKNFNIGDSKLVRARFERYLAMTTDAKEFKDYQLILAEINALLAASNDELSEKTIRHAWSRLYDAAEYQFDGDSSLLTANCVYTSWRMKDEYFYAKRQELDDIVKVKEDKFLLKSHSVYGETAKKNFEEGRSAKQLGIKREPFHAAEIAYRTVELQESRAKLLKSETRREAVALKAILQYQSQIVMFLTERKFQAAQIASMFYRHIYRGSSQALQVGEKELQQMIPISKFTPDIDMVEGIANEARNDVKGGMNAVNALYDSGDRFGALERLQETFVIGEFDPILYTFDPAKRKVLHRIYKNTITMKKLSESRDWGGIETILEQMKIDAPDFPITEVLSRVRTAQRASDMHLLAARQAAAKGETDEVRTSISEAMKLWPLNPKIETLNNELVGLSMGSTIYEKKFDEFLAKEKYRDIAAEAPEYGIVLRQDAERLKKLREIVIKIGRLDALIAQAREMERQKNPYFAWDILENAKDVDAKDPELARALAQLAPEVSDYVKALNNAKKAENAGDYACALNLYLLAQQIFPASQACRLGIERTAPLYSK